MCRKKKEPDCEDGRRVVPDDQPSSEEVAERGSGTGRDVLLSLVESEFEDIDDPLCPPINCNDRYLFFSCYSL